ncbi:DNA-directed RNA polymerase subunit beta [Paraliobacillus sp. PM-2]|uniref:DNA-directed RNA polymerase subunit beta n=1 Tax=Paraliobacillus sp. PM-2 TaxID=1462524 RepID=UPI00061B9AB8|nr:DNA-directed RNA polymerase subunit beta [Paraliobacillus sp. PM-2]CQR46183.1 DNA-directed RNA polymerase subunit beta [Paraliobacillus sp. PM-2]
MEPTQSNETNEKNVVKQEQTEDIQNRRRKKQREKKKQDKRPVRRVFPIWLRIVVVFIFSFLALIIGLVVGYSVLGDGAPMEVLELDTWQHIIDIVTGGS